MIQALPTGPLVQAIGWALLHLLWQGALVAALLAVALACMPGRSRARYLVSCGALAFIVVMGVATGIRSYQGATPAALVPVSGIGLVAPTVASVGEDVAQTLAPDRLRALVAAANDALPRIVTLWLMGVLVFSIRLLLDGLRVRRLLHPGALSAPEPWPSVARRLGAALGVRHVVRVLESAAVEVPSVIGLLRPAILIPASTLAGLTPAQLEMILAHELAHVRRHDFLVNLLQTVVETLLFYHPAVWWVSRQIRTERENCCDDLAVGVCGDRLRYARALLRLEELRAQRLALAMSADGGSLFDRIRRIARGSARPSGAALRATGALAVPLVLVIVLALPSLSAIGRARDDRPLSIASKGAATGAATGAEAAAAPAGAAAQSMASEPASPAGRAGDPALAVAAAGRPRADEALTSEPAGDAETSAEEPEPPTLDDLIALRAQNVTPQDIRTMRSLIPTASLQDIATMKMMGASPQFIREMRRGGLPVMSAQEAQGLAALGVTREFIREMRSVGFPVTTAEEAQGLKAVGVTAAFVREMRAKGLAVSAQDAQGLAAVGVTVEYIDQLRQAGIDVEDASNVQSLRALGITPEFIQKLADAGYRNLTVDQLTRLGAAGLNDSFIREMSRYRTR